MGSPGRTSPGPRHGRTYGVIREEHGRDALELAADEVRPLGLARQGRQGQLEHQRPVADADPRARRQPGPFDARRGQVLTNAADVDGVAFRLEPLDRLDARTGRPRATARRGPCPRGACRRQGPTFATQAADRQLGHAAGIEVDAEHAATDHALMVTRRSLSRASGSRRAIFSATDPNCRPLRSMSVG